MNDSAGLEKLQKWMNKNKVGLISRPGNRGNRGNRGSRVTTYLYNIINNNNINIIDSANPTQEAVTLGQMQGVTGVTKNSALSASELPRLPVEKDQGNQNNQAISTGLPQLPELPASEGDGGVGSEKVFLSEFLAWADAEIAKWPRDTQDALLQIQVWFRAKGYVDPADLILAFVTVRDVIKRKGGPVVLAPELAELERVAKEVYGCEARLYLAPEAARE
jgi:hypothetical protein